MDAVVANVGASLRGAPHQAVGGVTLQLIKRSSAMRNLLQAILSSKTCFRFLMLVAVFGALTALAPLSGAAPTSLSITVVNNSSWEIRHLYLSPADNDNWGVDQL